MLEDCAFRPNARSHMNQKMTCGTLASIEEVQNNDGFIAYGWVPKFCQFPSLRSNGYIGTFSRSPCRLGSRKCLFRNEIGLHSTMGGFTGGVVLKIRDDTQDKREYGDDSSENDFGSPPFIRHLKWPLFGLFCVIGVGLFSAGLWFFTEGECLKGVLFLIPAVGFAVVGTVILCVYF